MVFIGNKWLLISLSFPWWFCTGGGQVHESGPYRISSSRYALNLQPHMHLPSLSVPQLSYSSAMIHNCQIFSVSDTLFCETHKLDNCPVFFLSSRSNVQYFCLVLLKKPFASHIPLEEYVYNLYHHFICSYVNCHAFVSFKILIPRETCPVLFFWQDRWTVC